MNLIPIFLRRRLWILNHHWLSELTLTLLLPVGIYLSVVAGLNNVVRTSPDGIPFRSWVLPGLVFIITLIASYFPVVIDFFENRRIHPFLESVASTPNSGLAIVTAFTVSLLPEVIAKSLIAGIIVQVLGGIGLEILPFIGLIFFVTILGLFIINLALTVTMLAATPLLQNFVAFFIFLFIMFSSGWIVPLDYFPSSLASILSLLPTTQLLEGGRQLLFHSRITVFTWLMPFLISLIWIILNSAIFRKVNTL